MTHGIPQVQTTQAKQFLDWLQGQEGIAADQRSRVKKLFEVYGVPTSGEQDSLAVQHHIGLAYREVLKEHYKREIELESESARNFDFADKLATLKQAASPGRHAFASIDDLSSAAQLMGLEISTTHGTHPRVTFSNIPNQPVIAHTGEDNAAHFNTGDDPNSTIGNGNCAFNALAQVSAGLLGITLTVNSDPNAEATRRANYTAGAYTPEKQHEGITAMRSMDTTLIKEMLSEAGIKISGETATDAQLNQFIQNQHTALQTFRSVMEKTVELETHKLPSNP